MDAICSLDQKQTSSGVYARHQNGVAERKIKAVTSWTCAMIIHVTLYWSDATNVELWSFALSHIVHYYLWNHLPHKNTKLSSIELLSRSKFLTHKKFNHLHVWDVLFFLDLHL